MQYKLLIVALLGCLAITSALNLRHLGSGGSGGSSHGSTHGSTHGSSGQQQASGAGSAVDHKKMKDDVEKAVVKEVKDGKTDVSAVYEGKPELKFGAIDLKPGHHHVVISKNTDGAKKFAKENPNQQVICVTGKCSGSGDSASHGGSSKGSHNSGASAASHKGSSGASKKGASSDFAGIFNEMTEGAEAADADDADGAIINEAAAPSAEDAEEGLSQDEVEDQDEALEFLELFESSSHSNSGAGSKHGSSGASSHHASSGAASKHSSSGAKNFHKYCVEGDKLVASKGSGSSSGKHSGSKGSSSGKHSGSSSAHHSSAKK